MSLYYYLNVSSTSKKIATVVSPFNPRLTKGVVVTHLTVFPGRSKNAKGSDLHREIVPPRETVAIARVAIAIVGRGG